MEILLIVWKENRMNSKFFFIFHIIKSSYNNLWKNLKKNAICEQIADQIRTLCEQRNILSAILTVIPMRTEWKSRHHVYNASNARKFQSVVKAISCRAYCLSFPREQFSTNCLSEQCKPRSRLEFRSARLVSIRSTV